MSTHRSKSYISNNPYGSLERKAHKQRRSANRRNDSTLTSSQHATMSSSYSARENNSSNSISSGKPPTYRPPPDYKRQQQQADAAGHVTNFQPPVYRPRTTQHVDKEYAHHVQRASRRMYDSAQSQPFQMLDNPYYTQRRNAEKVPPHAPAGDQTVPIPIEPRPPRLMPRMSSEHIHTDSSSSQGSPKENAFSFFNNLNAFVQSEVRVPPTDNPYANVGPAEPPRPPRTYAVNEQSKPFEMRDFFQYSERLRRARGLPGANPRPPIAEPQPPPVARSAGTRTPSIEGSRSASPYTFGIQSKCLRLRFAT